MSHLGEIDAAILCGGLGKRLRSEIGDTQKTMAAIQDRPFLDILLDYLIEHGFARVVLCTGFGADQVEQYYRGRDFPLQIEYSHESEPLGTGGAIKHARSLIQSDSFFLLNGDSFCPVDYQKFLEFHLSHNSLATVAISDVEERKDFGSILIDDESHIVSFEEKVHGQEREDELDSYYVNAGVYCFAKSIFDLMPEPQRFSIEKDFFSKLAAKHSQEFFGYEIQDDFIDIGTPQRFQGAKKYFEKNG